MDSRELTSIPLFEGAEEREIDSLASVLTERVLEPGEALFERGDKAWHCYIVLSGSIKVLNSPTDAGDEGRVLAQIERGEILGEVCLIDGGKRSARCTAGEEGARLAELARPEFEMIFNAGSKLAFRLIDLMATQLVQRVRTTTMQLQDKLSDRNAQRAE